MGAGSAFLALAQSTRTVPGMARPPFRRPQPGPRAPFEQRASVWQLYEAEIASEDGDDPPGVVDDAGRFDGFEAP